MPLIASSFYLPQSPALPFILEDKYIKGGYKVLDTITDRDGLHPFARKEGQLVFVKEDKTLYQLEEDLLTWKEATFGGGVDLVQEPLYLKADGTLAIREIAVLPTDGLPGQTIEWMIGDTVAWVDREIASGMRSSAEFAPDTALQMGESLDFSLTMPKTVLLLAVKLNAPDLQIEGFSTELREDKNPYTFISHPDIMSDEGIKIVDGSTQIPMRRYAFMANQDTPLAEKQHFRLTNRGALAVTPVVSISYLTLE